MTRHFRFLAAAGCRRLFRCNHPVKTRLQMNAGWVLMLAVVLANTSHGQQEERAGVEFDLTGQLGIVAQQPQTGPFVEVNGKFMVPYTQSIPGTGVSFRMIPVPGGQFTMGSGDDRAPASSRPEVEVEVQPFWIAAYEVTWAEYQCYMAMDETFKKLQRRGIRKVTKPDDVDAVTAPSALYEPDITYEAGDASNEPAASMTQFAAKQYTKWLSLLTGQFYRIPYGAEWEYACRAGTTTKYYFGDTDDALEEHAWFADNADESRHVCGKKQPNPWGIYDMYGNVSEWVLDAYTEDGHASLVDEQPHGEKVLSAEDTFKSPQKVYPRVLRGGSFVSDAVLCNSAARLGSHAKDWKEEDPNYPKSPWWYTSEEGLGTGIRLIRPYRVPDDHTELLKFWDSDSRSITRDALSRIDSNGRGAIGSVDQNLADDIKKIGK